MGSFRLQIKKAMRRIWESDDGEKLASQIRTTMREYGKCLEEKWEDGSISKDEIRDCLKDKNIKDRLKNLWLGV